MSEQAGFYKVEDGQLIFNAGTVRLSDGFAIHASRHALTKYPAEGWYYFKHFASAVGFFGLPADTQTVRAEAYVKPLKPVKADANAPAVPVDEKGYVIKEAAVQPEPEPVKAAEPVKAPKAPKAADPVVAPVEAPAAPEAPAGEPEDEATV
jgi:hypothetical protein